MKDNVIIVTLLSHERFFGRIFV